MNLRKCRGRKKFNISTSTFCFEIQRNSPWDLQNLCWLVFSAPYDNKWSCKMKGKHWILDPFSIKVLSEITLEDQKYTMALLFPEYRTIAGTVHCMLQQHAYYSPLNHYAMLLKDTRVDNLEGGGGGWKIITLHNFAISQELHTNEFVKWITCTQIYHFIKNNVIIFYSRSYKEKN